MSLMASKSSREPYLYGISLCSIQYKRHEAVRGLPAVIG